MANVGFIGLGIMGKPMALNLAKAGHKLFVHSRSGVPPEMAGAGAALVAIALRLAPVRAAP